MNALFLSAMLMLGAASANPPEVFEVVQEELLPLCNPPQFGDWWLASDCLLGGSQTVPGNVFVVGSSTLELAPGATLNISFQTHRLWIGVGSRVVIGDGGRIH